MPALYISSFLLKMTQCVAGFSLLLECYVIKSQDAKNPAIFQDKGNAGSGNEIGENPVKCSACVVGQKIEIECLTVFSEMRTFHKNHSLEFHKRWQDET